jgi:hypothetical protein
MPGRKMRSIKGPHRMYEALKGKYGKTRAAKITNAFGRRKTQKRRKRR